MLSVVLRLPLKRATYLQRFICFTIDPPPPVCMCMRVRGGGVPTCLVCGYYVSRHRLSILDRDLVSFELSILESRDSLIGTSTGIDAVIYSYWGAGLVLLLIHIIIDIGIS